MIATRRRAVAWQSLALAISVGLLAPAARAHADATCVAHLERELSVRHDAPTVGRLAQACGGALGATLIGMATDRHQAMHLRLRAIHALGLMTDVAAGRPLVALATSTGDRASVRRAAVAALGRPHLRADLLGIAAAVLADRDPHVRRAAAMALTGVSAARVALERARRVETVGFVREAMALGLTQAPSATEQRPLTP